MGDYSRIAGADELQPGQAKVVEVGGKVVALFNVAGTFYATDNTCLHRGGPLGEGFLQGNVVTCPWHGWNYDVTTGVCPVNPNSCLKTYPVKVEGTDVQIAL